MRDSKGRVSQASPDRERRNRDARLEVEPVVLTRKYAEAINGIDLGGREVGDRLPLNRRDADVLIAEGWARPVSASERRHTPERGSDPPGRGRIA